jgi:proline-specific peptidase
MPHRSLELSLAHGRVHVEVAGDDGGGAPVLVLHGGPGAGCEYLTPLDALAQGRQVIRYDQLGCGRSERPDDPSLWTPQRFADEVDEVRSALRLERIHLLGQSWGGMLAIEYLLRNPRAVASAVLSDTAASAEETVAGMQQALSALPEDERRVLLEGDATGNVDTPAYQGAMLDYAQRYTCRLPLRQWPPELLSMPQNVAGNPSRLQLWGPREYDITGTLRSWDRRDQLANITVPTLVTVGRFGDMGPDCAETIVHRISGAQLVIFEDSGHLPHIEESERYLAVVGDFLKRHDG